MQTLLDPFELVFPPPPGSVRFAPLPEPVLEVQSDRESAPPPSLPPSPDSSGRLRCWCSDDY
jgi:hypothetical protein